MKQVIEDIDYRPKEPILYKEENWQERGEEIESGDVFVLRLHTPVFVCSINRWVDCLAWSGPKEVYYQKTQLVADYIQVDRVEKEQVFGKLVYIPAQTGNSESVEKTKDNCSICVNTYGLYHKLTEDEMKFINVLPWIDVLGLNDIDLG